MRAVLILGLAASAVSAEAFEPLPRGDPEAHDIDRQRLEDGMEQATGMHFLQGVVIVRDGCVVGEWFEDGQPARRRAVWSVTKSVMSTLIGVAVEHGFISGVNAPMVDYLPPDLVPEDPSKHDITVRHLLTMTSGLAWSERSNWYEWVASPEPARWILLRPLEAEPGSLWVYSTASTHLLSVVLSEATGMGAADFGEEYLFQPLGFDAYDWESDPRGHPFGGHGLYLRTEDMAKLGVLFLNGGVFGEREIVSAEWCDWATDIEYPLGARYGPLRDLHYGRLWWVDRSLDHGVYAAWGFAGQFVFCVPGLQLVVATNASSSVDWQAADQQETAILDWIVADVLPAVTDRTRPPRRVTRRLHGVRAPAHSGSAVVVLSPVVASDRTPGR